MKYLILIPAYNSELSIRPLIGQLRKELSTVTCTIVVVNDGSTDNTEKIAVGLGIQTISHNRNLGKGNALRSGFTFAQDEGFDAIVTIDADLQHDPSVLPRMMSQFEAEKSDILIGVRHFSGGMSWARRLSNSVTSAAMTIKTGVRIPDSQSGYRIMKTKSVKSLNLRTGRYETESEILIKLARQNARFGFYPIPTIYNNEKSYIDHFRDTLRFIKMYLTT